MEKCWIHADDFGLSPAINQGIMQGIEGGALNSVSIIPNGYAFQQAIDYYTRSSIDISVHLNFLEGKSVSGKTHPAFTDGQGFFSGSFFSHFRLSRSLSGIDKEAYESFLREEMRAQVGRIQPYLKPEHALRVDSHQHLHMIPAFREILFDLVPELEIACIRIPREAYFKAFGFQSWKRSWGINRVKWVLLNRLSAQMVCRAQERKLTLPLNYYFSGILNTGTMKKEMALNFLEKHPSGIREVLFHPGGTNPSEKQYWEKYPDLWAYYSSPQRAEELHELIRMKQDGKI